MLYKKKYYSENKLYLLKMVFRHPHTIDDKITFGIFMKITSNFTLAELNLFFYVIAD